LQCSEFDNSEALFGLDGGADLQRDLVIKATRSLKRRVGAKSVRKFIRNVRNQADELYRQNWVLTWSVPLIVQSCDSEVLCVQTDYSGVTVEYNDNAQTLHELVGKVVKRLRKKLGKKKAGKKFLQEADQALEENLALAASVATISSNCDL
jgi:hypothetical protein